MVVIWSLCFLQFVLHVEHFICPIASIKILFSFRYSLIFHDFLLYINELCCWTWILLYIRRRFIIFFFINTACINKGLDDLLVESKRTLNWKEPNKNAYYTWDIVAEVGCITSQRQEDDAAYPIEKGEIESIANNSFKHQEINHIRNFGHSQNHVFIDEME